MSVLKVENLTKSFKSGFWPFTTSKTHTVVNEISFELKKGEILGFLGTNGAGKTTTIQMLLGTLTPTNGAINYFGYDFEKNKIAALKKIGYASGYDRLPARLTVYENLDVVGRIYGIPQDVRSEKIKNLLKFFGILNLKDTQTGKLSAGQTTRVMLAKAFICDPEIVLLDEPTASLDPDIANEVRQFILEQSNNKYVSILITSHNMSEVTELCDRVLVLKNGKIIADNSPEVLAKTISKIHVNLTLSDFDKIIKFLDESNLKYTIETHNIIVDIDEYEIAQFLANLAERKIIYSQISIDKPTLEDYFLSIAK